VVSDLDVFRGFLADGESALMAPPGDSAALARAIVRIAGDAELARRLRKGGLDVAALHGWDRVAEAQEHAYRDLLRAR
jgi:glycosyltransferase involved in cell wall biosynthesis